jgi:hypothetical protein
MVREMITLPLRVGVSATRLSVDVTIRAAGLAFRIARLAIATSAPPEPSPAAADARPASSTVAFDVIIASSPSRPEAPPPEVPPRRAVAAEPEVGPTRTIPPMHVSEGLQFVEAFAEPGAEEGAGAAVHVREPWTGYAQLTADEVIVHLAGASPEELAAVTLYEGAHRGRKTVLAQARRQLRLATAGNAAP